MYWQHFGLSAEPFSLTPDPAFLYMSEGHAEALAALKLGLLERRGLLAMIGEVGTGKTTLLYSLLAGLEAEIKTAYVSNTRLSFEGILRTILSDFGVTPASEDRVDMLDCLNDFLVECAEQDTTAALIIDEAQNLSAEAFEEIRLLSNFETYTTKLLQIVLVGQPELATKLNERELRQINERIAVRCYLNPLSEAESRSYIEHRLAAAGGDAQAFSKRALRTIISWSSGIPRRINILCHNSLLFAYGRSLAAVTPGIVEDAIHDQEGAGLRRFDQPARYEDPGLGGAIGLDRSPLVRWALGGIAVGVTGALLLASGRTEEPAAVAAVAPTSVEVAAVEPTPSRERRQRVERRAERRQKREPALAAQPTPYKGLSPAVQQQLERVLAELEAAARTEGAASAPPPPAVAPAAAQSTGEATGGIATPTSAANALPVTERKAPSANDRQARSADTAAAVTTIANATGPLQRQAAGERETSARPRVESRTTTGDGARIMIVPAGSTLSALMVEVYGFYRTDLLEAIRDANPHIADPDQIRAGETVVFPDLTELASRVARTEAP